MNNISLDDESSSYLIYLENLNNELILDSKEARDLVKGLLVDELPFELLISPLFNKFKSFIETNLTRLYSTEFIPVEYDELIYDFLNEFSEDELNQMYTLIQITTLNADNGWYKLISFLFKYSQNNYEYEDPVSVDELDLFIRDLLLEINNLYKSINIYYKVILILILILELLLIIKYFNTF